MISSRTPSAPAPALQAPVNRFPRSTPPSGGARNPNAGQPQALGDVLSRYLSRSGLSAKVEAASVIPEWEGLVGPQIAAVTVPRRVSEGVLFVAVHTSSWMMELDLMKGELMRRLNAGKTTGKIRQIVFLMGDGTEGS